MKKAIKVILTIYLCFSFCFSTLAKEAETTKNVSQTLSLTQSNVTLNQKDEAELIEQQKLINQLSILKCKSEISLNKSKTCSNTLSSILKGTLISAIGICLTVGTIWGISTGIKSKNIKKF